MKQGIALLIMIFMCVVALGLIWFNILHVLDLSEQVNELEDRNDILIEENVHLKDYLEKNT